MIGRVCVVILVAGLSAAGRVTQADARSVSIPRHISRRAILGSPLDIHDLHGGWGSK